MKTIVIYKQHSDHARAVETFMGDYERVTGGQLEAVDPETREGADLCRTHDIVEYPSVVALADDGSIRQLWRGIPLPLVSEVSYFAR